MSIENNLKRIADALEQIAQTGAIAQPEPQNIVPSTPPVPAAQPAAQPEPQNIVPPTPPVPPTPVAASGASEESSLFTDVQQLVQYVMVKYQSLGPEKGSKINDVLVGLGYNNINDIQPIHFAEFHKQVEAIQ